MESTVAGVAQLDVSLLNVVGHHDAFTKLGVGGDLTIHVFAGSGVLQAGLTKNVCRCVPPSQRLRPLHDLLVKPVAKVLRLEIGLDILGRPWRLTLLEESADLLTIRGEDVGVAGPNLQEIVEQAARDGKPLLDAPLALDLE